MLKEAAGTALLFTVLAAPVAIVMTRDKPAPLQDDATIARAVLASTTRPALGDDIPGLAGETRRREQDEPEPTELLAAPETGVALGWGWNSFHQEAIPSTCIEFVSAPVDNAQTIALDFNEVNDTYELQKALNISAEGSVKTMAVEVSGEAKFAKNTKVEGSSLTYVIEAEVLNSPDLAAPAAPEGARPSLHGSVRLTPNAERLAKRDVELFKDVCGTGYVSSTMTGAKLSVVVSIKTRSKSERTTVSASVEGKGWGAKVKAAMSGSSASGSTSANREIHFFQQGGKPDKIPTEVDDIVAHVQGLATDAGDNGKIFRIGVTPYEVLENWPREDEITGDDREFEQLAAFWGAYRALYDDLESAFEAPNAYSVPVAVCDDAGCNVEFHGLQDEGHDLTLRMEDLQDEIIATLDRLEIAARNCMLAEEECDTDLRTYRDPYAVRVRMPMLTCALKDSWTAEEEADHGAAKLATWNVAYPTDEVFADLASVPNSYAPNQPLQVLATRESKEAIYRGQVDGTLTPDETTLLDERAFISDFQVDPVCDTPAGTRAESTALDAYGDAMISELAKGRCKLGTLTPGCITNKAIRAWRARIGMNAVILEGEDGIDALRAALASDDAAAVSCKAVTDKDMPSGDPETRLQTSLWYPAGCEARVQAALMPKDDTQP